MTITKRLKCKCGISSLHPAINPEPCRGCKRCKTTFGTHEPLQPHIWKERINNKTKAMYKVCAVCKTVDIKTWKESKRHKPKKRKR